MVRNSLINTNKMKYKIGDKVEYNCFGDIKEGIIKDVFTDCSHAYYIGGYGVAEDVYKSSVSFIIKKIEDFTEKPPHKAHISIADVMDKAPEGFGDLKIDRCGDTPEDSWYTKGSIQPIEYIEANNLGFREASIIKYVTRYKYKDGLKDLKKVRYYLDRLIKEQEDAR